jgi:sugar/nucleoside kinase (ribokinase family)
MKKNKAVVAGHICLDITPVFFARKDKAGIGDYLSPGKTLLMKDYVIHTGGSVSNTGLAMKKLGADVVLMAKTGRDPFGKLVENILAENSAEYRLASSDAPTAYTIIIAPPGIDRIFLHNPGANDTFTGDDLDYDAIGEARLFHFGYPPVMRKMYENAGRELVKIFSKVKSAGLVTSLDMTAIDPDSDAGNADWTLILENVLPYVDFFLPSIEELLFMLDRKKYDNFHPGKTRINRGELDSLSERLHGMGVKGVVIKCGEDGLYYNFAEAESLVKLSAQAGRDVTEWGGQSGITGAYETGPVHSATGAGDTSIAAFLTAFLAGESLTDCLELAAATGACCVQEYDALSGIMSLDEIKQKIRNGWKKKNYTE